MMYILSLFIHKNMPHVLKLVNYREDTNND